MVDWFWRAVASFDDERRAALLRFWTGASSLGPGGFGEERGFTIVGSTRLTEHSLPEAQTCSRTIALGPYRSYEQTRDKLKSAVDYGAEGFAFA